MPVPAQLRASEIGREIGGLALSVVAHDEPMLCLRAVAWRNALVRVGLTVPLWVAHDLGLCAVIDPALVPIGPRGVLGASGVSEPDVARAQAWAALVREIGASEVMEKARGWRLGDDLIAVLLLRALSGLAAGDGPGRRSPVAPLPLDADLFRDLGPDLARLFAAHDRTRDLHTLARLAAERLRIVIALEQIDLDTLRLLGLFGPNASGGPADAMLDLLAVLESPEANDVVDFSLDLLPSLLETKRASGRQRFAVDGYAGLDRRGTLDSLVLTELAYDDEIFDQRFVEGEVFYHAREKQREEERRLHYVVVDATASMRGERSTFARGLALALVKKLGLRGEDVWLRFFDSRLYEAMRARGRRHVRAGHGAVERGLSIPWILTFRGEHGRHYARVFADLAGELERLSRRERRAPILYFVTHAECHIPLDVVERLRAVARLYGIFMLPSRGALDLPYLDRLHTVQVVDEASLGRRTERARRALDIVEDAARPGASEP